MPRYKRSAELTHWLPALPVTERMRDQIETMARSENVSLSEVQRRALLLFLQGNYSKSIEKSSETKEQSA